MNSSNSNNSNQFPYNSRTTQSSPPSSSSLRTRSPYMPYQGVQNDFELRPPTYHSTSHPIDVWQEWYENNQSIIRRTSSSNDLTGIDARYWRYPTSYEYTDTLNQRVVWGPFLTGTERVELDNQLRRFMKQHVGFRPRPRSFSVQSSRNSSTSSSASGVSSPSVSSYGSSSSTLVSIPERKRMDENDLKKVFQDDNSNSHSFSDISYSPIKTSGSNRRSQNTRFKDSSNCATYPDPTLTSFFSSSPLILNQTYSESYLSSGSGTKTSINSYSKQISPSSEWSNCNSPATGSRMSSDSNFWVSSDSSPIANISGVIHRTRQIAHAISADDIQSQPNAAYSAIAPQSRDGAVDAFINSNDHVSDNQQCIWSDSSYYNKKIQD